MFTMELQIPLEGISGVVMPMVTWALLGAQLVAPWPYIKGPCRQSDDTLHAPCVIFISMCWSRLTSTALQGTACEYAHGEGPGLGLFQWGPEGF